MPNNEAEESALLKIGAALMAAAIILGAFSAHALKTRLTPDSLEVIKTAVLYLLVHSLGLIAISIVSSQKQISTRAARTASRLFLTGILLFSGSLLLLATTGVKQLGAVTPFGGIMFICGWLVVFAAAGRKTQS